jgi:hypothetical protein
VACYASQNAAIAADSADSIPFIPPITLDESQYYTIPSEEKPGFQS